MGTTADRMLGCKTLVLQAALLLGSLLLLMLNLNPNSPYAALYGLFGRRSPQQPMVKALEQIDQNFRATAAGGNLLLHLPGYDLADPSQAMHAGGLYFRANYILFPHRAYVGDRARVINMASQLIPEDHTPPPAWMGSHDIRGICVYPGTAGDR